jgi:hypothetical protein
MYTCLWLCVCRKETLTWPSLHQDTVTKRSPYLSKKSRPRLGRFGKVGMTPYMIEEFNGVTF